MIYSPSRNWHWVTLIGPDAQDFLHRLTTCDVKNLPVGSGTPGCFLSAQGKMRAYFHLWHYRPTEFAFEFDGGEFNGGEFNGGEFNGGEDHTWKTSLLQTIDQYTFAEKMTLVDVTAEGDSRLACRWIFPSEGDSSEALAVQPGQTLATDEEIRLCHHGVADFGRPWISAWGSPARLEPWVDRNFGGRPELKASTLEKWRIEAARPRVGAELDPSTIPLEAGLIDAIAQAKGCYPGQEVVERILSLGSPARRLVKLEGTSPAPSTGDLLFNSSEASAKLGGEVGPELGRITSVATEGDRFVALGFVKKIFAKEGLEVRISSSSSHEKAVQTARITQVTAYAPASRS